MIDAAGGRYSRSILSQHRHVCGTQAVQIWGDVVILEIMCPVTADQGPYVAGKIIFYYCFCYLRTVKNFKTQEEKRATIINNGEVRAKFVNNLLPVLNHFFSYCSIYYQPLKVFCFICYLFACGV